MTCDIFLRSYWTDAEFARYALRSIYKFVTGIRDVVIVVPANDYAKFKSLNLTKEILCSSKFAASNLDDYLLQQADKLLAHLYTDADTILFWDSDCVAVRKFSPSDLLIGDRPRWLMTPYSKLVNPDGSQATPWRPITAKAIGRDPEFEFMRMQPFLVGRRTLVDFREFMEGFHGCKLEDYISSQPARAFSEWNAIGAWAYYHQPGAFAFWHTDVSVPEPFVRQAWSWGGLTPEVIAEFEKVLA